MSDNKNKCNRCLVPAHPVDIESVFTICFEFLILGSKGDSRDQQSNQPLLVSKLVGPIRFAQAQAMAVAGLLGGVPADWNPSSGPDISRGTSFMNSIKIYLLIH